MCVCVCISRYISRSYHFDIDYILAFNMEAKSKEILSSENTLEDQLNVNENKILIAEIKRLKAELNLRDKTISDLTEQIHKSAESFEHKLNDKYLVIEQLKVTIHQNEQCIKDLQRKLHMVSQLNTKSVTVKIETENEEINLHSNFDTLYVTKGKPQNTNLEQRLKDENHIIELEKIISELKVRVLEKEQENEQNIREKFEIEEVLKKKNYIIYQKQMKIEKYIDQITDLNTKFNELYLESHINRTRNRNTCCFLRCLTACFRNRN